MTTGFRARPSLPRKGLHPEEGCGFASNGIDHRTHDEQNAAIAAFVRCRNGRAEPKVRFAPGSPIRQWTGYPAESA